MCAVSVDWNSLGGTGDGDGKSAFLRFKSGNVYTVRPVGHAVEFYRFFIEGNPPKTVNVDPDKKDEAAKILSKYAGSEINPQHKFAINVIDRSDNQIKIMEGGWSIFKLFANWAKVHGQHPGGKSGADWTIDVEGEKLNRRYTTMPGQSKPFKAEEIDRIKNKKEMYVLSDIYKSCPMDGLIEKAFGDTVDNNTDTAAQQKPTETQETVGAAKNLSDNPVDW
jgi:hypothetical protein